MTRSPLACLGLAALAAGCASGPSDDSSTMSADLAAAAGETAAQNVEMMRGPGGLHGFGFRFDPGTFDCAPKTREGLTVTMSCTYKDAGGATQAGYDATTTASVTVAATVKGTFDRGPMSGSVDRTSTMTVTGLAGAETQMTWNGSESGKMTHSHAANDRGGARSYEMTFTGTTTNVVVPVPRTESSWPKSGTITHRATVKFIGGEKDGTTETRDVTITFDGTQYVTVTVNGETFTVDLARRGGRAERGRHRP